MVLPAILVPGLEVELINVGGWLANFDEVLETKADFLVVTEHRLVPARTRSESKRLKTAGFYSLWTPACQESAHVGHAGVGLVSLRRAPLFHAVPSTHEFRVWVKFCRVMRSVIPVGDGRVVHVVVVYGLQGADGDQEKLTRTEQLFQAVMCELKVVGDGHPFLLFGDFNMSLLKSLVWLKGFRKPQLLILKITFLLVGAIWLPLHARMCGILKACCLCCLYWLLGGSVSLV